MVFREFRGPLVLGFPGFKDPPASRVHMVPREPLGLRVFREVPAFRGHRARREFREFREFKEFRA
jgi:hypothetical protein